jgi:hypothetical protein
MTDDTNDNAFVTVLRSRNAGYVDGIIAMLAAEGIPCQHPGKNHAALEPGYTYFDIELRVPVQFEADARSLIAAMADTSSRPGEDNVAFRVVRNYGRVMAIAGSLVGMALTIEYAQSLTPVTVFAILGAAPCAGFLLGKCFTRRFCSRPGCASVLHSELHCPKCGAVFHGDIESARAHYDALEALKAEGGGPARRN